MINSRINKYHSSLSKRIFDVIFSFIALAMLSPLIIFITILIKLSSRGPVLFIQKRNGKDGKEFNIIKFRTMYKGSEQQLHKYLHLNETDGPVFKMKNDPRFTRLGKLFAKTGLDEIPQFMNVLKGEISIVGPRPLPTYEAKKISKKQRIRENIKPGITSEWIVNGAHSLTFAKWMRLDRDYINNASLLKDTVILLKSIRVVIHLIFKRLILFNFNEK